MQWAQGTTTDREGITRENKHFQRSDCGKYQVSGSKSGEQFRYHAWVDDPAGPPAGALYSAGPRTNRDGVPLRWWHCIAVTDDPAAAKQICAEHATERGVPADDTAHSAAASGTE